MMQSETARSNDRPERDEARVVPPGGSLLIKSGFFEGLEVPLDREWVVIGRGRSADVVIAEPTISRAHAAVGFDKDEGFFVQDLGSTNGTLVNGAKAQRQRLKGGDELRMGRLRIQVELPE
jgi:pSer/pThr/pTyr-binding forkhead associated (FHA) protein